MNSNIPNVSVIMPCRNEEKFIAKAIESLVDDYFLKNCELIVIDGMSEDKTRDIINSFIKKGFPIRYIENKNKLQAHGLNLGITVAKGEIIVRTDAHCIYPPAYIKKCINLLETKKASNAGGVMHPHGNTSTQKAIALALQHPIGVGDAKFHIGNFSGYVDTVFLGTYRKNIFNEIGLFDPNCHPNEDAEFNLRILKAGKKIYLDNSIKITYFPRESLKKLAQQYFRYGQGRCLTTLKHRKITSFRQLTPIILILGLISSLILSYFRPLFLAIPLFYFLSLLITALITWPSKKIPLKQRLIMSMAFAIMHITWGAGFLSTLFLRRKRKKP